MANCVTKYFTKKGFGSVDENSIPTKKTFRDRPGVVVQVMMTDNVEWNFGISNISGGEFIGIKGDVEYITNGKWQCDGDENFIITGNVTKSDGTKKDQTYSSKTNLWVDVVTNTTTQISPSLYCVINGLKSMGKTWKIGKDNSIVADMGVGAGGFLYYRWYFYPPKENRNSWVEYNLMSEKVTLSGTWSCLDSTNFKLTRSDGKTYIGGGSGWEDPTAPESTTEPTDPESTTEPDFDRTKFPLKKGSEGKEVIQLQNYLNKEIPANPLVIDGIFGDLTHNKLVQVQKNKGVL